MPKRLIRLLAFLCLCLPAHAQDTGIGIDVTSLLTLGANSIYTAALDGIGSYPSVPLAARGDIDPTDATSLAGAANKYPRQGFLPNTRCKNGDILFVYEAHDGNGATGDTAIPSILIRRSTDNGNSYGAPYTLYRNSSHSTGVNFLNTGTIGIDSVTGRVHFLFTHTTGATAGVAATAGGIQVKYLFSDDHGLTWGGTTATDGTPRDLTNTLKKQSGLTPPYDETNAAWGWNIFGPGAMIQLRNGPYAGRLLAPANHRYSLDNTGTPWSHCVYSDDNGATWTLGGGLQETVADNDNSNEFAIAEYGTDGHIYGQCRIIGTNFRGATRSLDGGATWSNRIVNNGSNLSFDGSTTTTALTSLSTQGSLTSTPNGKLYALFPGDSTIRSHGILYESVSGGNVWEKFRYVTRRPFGYSGIMALDNTSLLTVFESSINTAASKTENVDWYQYILQRRLYAGWLDAKTTDPDYSYYVFNEKPNGTAVSLVGNQGKDRGNQLAHWKGLGGGLFSSTGLATNGSTAGIILSELNNASSQSALGNAWDIGNESVSVTLIGFSTSSAATTRTIISNNNGATGATAGYTFGLNTSHFPVFTYGDGTRSGSVTGSVVVDDGDTYNIRFTRNTTTNTPTIETYNVTDGGSVTTDTGSTDSASATQYVKGTTNCVFGARANNNNAIACNIEGLRFQRSVDTVPLNTVTVGTKQTLNQYIGDSYSLPAKAPSNLASCKLWLYATYNGYRNAGLDLTGGWDVGQLPYFNGSGVNTYREHTNDYLFLLNGNSPNRGTTVNYDSTVGRYYRPTFQGSATGYGYATSATMGTRLDFIQNTGVFTVCCALKFGTNQASMVLDNCNNSANNPGIAINRNTASAWFVRVSKGGGTNLQNDSQTINTSLNTWYFYSVTCSGAGTPINSRIVAYPGNLAAPTVPGSPTASTGNLGSVAGNPFASTQPLTIGSRSDGNANQADLYIKNLCIFDEVLTVSQMQSLAEFNVEH